MTDTVVIEGQQNFVAVESQSLPTVIEIQTEQPTITVEVELAPETLEIVAPGPQGQKGDKGDKGDSGTALSFTYQAAYPTSGHRAVTLNEEGKVIYASNDVLTHANRILGISLNAALEDDLIEVQKLGEVVEPSWNWNTTDPVYLSTDGHLTQVAPNGAAFSVVIGFPVSSTTLFLNIGIPIILV